MPRIISSDSLCSDLVSYLNMNKALNKALEPAPERIAALCGLFMGGAVQHRR